MIIKQYRWLDFFTENNQTEPPEADIVFVFASRLFIEKQIVTKEISSFFHNANVLYCSTAGEIGSDNISENSIVMTAIKFEKTEMKTACVNIDCFDNAKEAAFAITGKLYSPNLKHVLVFADGQKVNGSELTSGFNHALPNGITVSGGLAGDDSRFKKTIVGLDNNLKEGNIVAIGLYGDNILIGNGSDSGWETFGNSRVVTKAIGNKLFELDGVSALETYKTYLGDLAAQLPASALHFPLSVMIDKEMVTRTILSVNETDGSMTFAGDIPEGSTVKLMKASSQSVIDAARNSAIQSMHYAESNPEFALLISCVGRKLVLGKKTADEVDNAKSALGKNTVITGFFSYGEISSNKKANGAFLYNQTMTITTLSER